MVFLKKLKLTFRTNKRRSVKGKSFERKVTLRFSLKSIQTYKEFSLSGVVFILKVNNNHTEITQSANRI